MKRIVLLITLLLSLASCGFRQIDQKKYLEREGSSVARFELNPITQNPDTLYMNGVIYEGTPEDLKLALRTYPSAKVIAMGNVPGSIDDEMNLVAARLVRAKGLHTYLMANSEIASGGTDFFLAGIKRSITPGAKLGVHSWADDMGVEATEYEHNDEVHEEYLSYFRSMGIPPSFYWYTLEAAPSNEVHWMTAEELKTYKFETNE